MTFGGPAPGIGYFAVPVARYPNRVWLAWLAGAMTVGLVLAGVVAVSQLSDDHRALRVGDCVVVAASTDGELHAGKASCDTDPSFTVAALTKTTGNCAAAGYDRFTPPAADPGTGRLCLVPNLVADHCYQLGVAVGVWNLVDCAAAGPATIKVTERLDTADAGACRSHSRLPARSYAVPPRTYCLGFAV